MHNFLRLIGRQLEEISVAPSSLRRSRQSG